MGSFLQSISDSERMGVRNLTEQLREFTGIPKGKDACCKIIPCLIKPVGKGLNEFYRILPSHWAKTIHKAISIHGLSNIQ